ncbi:MAG: hypothetical protein M3Y87_15155 [Myxococcota bacterium]|nr:hypothetical protein [Myxococcota bacterium]
MADRTTFADPEREPTDEELIEFSREAFAGVAHANALALRAQIAEESTKVLERLASWTGTAGTTT